MILLTLKSFLILVGILGGIAVLTNLWAPNEEGEAWINGERYSIRKKD